MATKRKVGVLLKESDLKRRYPDSGLASEIILTGDRVLRLPCEVLSINYHLGGGIRYGSILEVGGEESTGKTLLAHNFIKVAQSMGGIALFDDAEAVFDGEWAEKHGVDLSRLVLLPFENEIELVSDWMADMIIYWRNKLTKNEPIVLVVDSVALLDGGESLETAEQDTKAEMGRRSLKMGALLRKRMKLFAKYGVCVILINQLRKKVGASRFEDPNTSPMDQVMKFYSSQRIRLFRGARIKSAEGKKGRWVGNLVYVRTIKNKSAIPRDSVKAKVYFREHDGNFGYDKYFGFDEILVEKGVVKRKLGRFTYKGNQIAKGESKFLEELKSNNELRGKLLKRLSINTPSKFRKKLENISKNLFPVKLKVKKDEKEEDTEG